MIEPTSRPPEFEIDDRRSIIADNTEILDLQSTDVADMRWAILDKLQPPCESPSTPHRQELPG